MFSLRVDLYEEGGFKEYQAGLEQAGKWRLAELSESFYPLPKGEPDVVSLFRINVSVSDQHKCH